MSGSAHIFTLPPDLAEGDYRLQVGLYERNGPRLALDGGRGDALPLAQIEVRR